MNADDAPDDAPAPAAALADDERTKAAVRFFKKMPVAIREAIDNAPDMKIKQKLFDKYIIELLDKVLEELKEE